MAAVEVDSRDVLRVVSQFLDESKLKRSAAELQAESGVALDAVEDMAAFRQSVLQGRWDSVLAKLSSIRVSPKLLFEVGEQVVFELLELREMDVARELLRHGQAFSLMREKDPTRFRRLAVMLSRGKFEEAGAHPAGVTKADRRKHLADSLAEEVKEAPRGRLVSLIGDALKWQRFQGTLPAGSKYDLLRGAAPTHEEKEDRVVKRLHGTVKFGSKSHAECCVFTRDGRRLVTGTVDGFVEVWDVDTCRLDKSLPYQDSDEVMLHDAAVHALACSADSELLASGSQDGCLKVWRLSTGRCLRRLGKAHTAGISCVAFTKEGSQVVTGSFDHSVRLHGLRSGKTLKEFRGHGSFVNAVLISHDSQRIASCSSDGTVRVWDARTSECVGKFAPTGEGVGSEDAMVALCEVPRDPGHFAALSKAGKVYLLTFAAESVREFAAGKAGTSEEWVACTASARGKYLYCFGASRQAMAIEVASGTVAAAWKTHDKGEPLGLVHHPHRSMVASFTSSGKLRLWAR